MPSLLKTGIKYGAIFGAAKYIRDGYSKSNSQNASRGEYASGTLQSEYTHESWCNGSCGDRCRSRGQQQQQPQYQQAQYQPQIQQSQPPHCSQIQWGQNGYVHQPGCKGECSLRCCDAVAPQQHEQHGLPTYQQY